MVTQEIPNLEAKNVRVARILSEVESRKLATTEQEILTRLRTCLEMSQADDFAEFSIYWGKKSQSVATALLNEFAGNGSNVIDPFLGSGSTIFGGLSSTKNLDLYGIDVNQQPIDQILFNLEACNLESINNSEKILLPFLDTETLHYRYEDEYGANLEFQKARVVVEDNLPRLQEIWLKDEAGKVQTYTKSESSFPFFEKQYRLKQVLTNGIDNLDLKTNSRIAIKSGMKISDMYSPVNFEFLLRYRALALQDAYLKGLLSSVLHLCKYTDKGSQSQFPFWYPKVDAYERNLVNLLRKKHLQIKKATQERELALTLFTNNSTYSIQQLPIQKVDQIFPENFFDLVITDPPYFDQVAYSEYLVVWEFFTGSQVDLENEIVESNRVNSDKNREEYLKSMEFGFTSLRKTCKTNSLMFFYYKDVRLGNIAAILQTLAKSGWKFIGQVHVDRKQFTYKQNSTKKNTVEGDCLMVFSASDTHSIPEQIEFDRDTICAIVLECAENFINTYGPSTLSTLYDNGLIPTLFEKGLLSEFKSPGDILKILDPQFRIDKETRKLHVNK